MIDYNNYHSIVGDNTTIVLVLPYNVLDINACSHSNICQTVLKSQLNMPALVLLLLAFICTMSGSLCVVSIIFNKFIMSKDSFYY